MERIDLTKINNEIKALQKTIDELDNRRNEIQKHIRDEAQINTEGNLKEDVDVASLNYIMGHSAGFVAGFQSAVNTVVQALASEYRDIPMTESELYLLTELGAEKERAWLKDNNQIRVVEKNGWKMEWNPSPKWYKEGSDGTNDNRSNSES